MTSAPRATAKGARRAGAGISARWSSLRHWAFLRVPRAWRKSGGTWSSAFTMADYATLQRCPGRLAVTCASAGLPAVVVTQFVADGGDERIHVLFGGVERTHPAHFPGGFVPVVEPEGCTEPVRHVLREGRRRRRWTPSSGWAGRRRWRPRRRGAGQPWRWRGRPNAARGRPSSRAMNWADMKRIFEASCMFILRRYTRPWAASGFRATTTSPNSRPFLVPPKDRMSTPASRVKARSGTCRWAAAFASRAPSMCSFMPLAWTWSAMAAHFLRGVAGAQFGGLGDGDGQRLCAVLVAPAPCLLVDQFRSQLSVRGGDLQELDAADAFRRTVFVHVDVGGGGADDGTPAGQQRLQREDVGSGAVEDREAFDAWRRSVPPEVSCSRAV